MAKTRKNKGGKPVFAGAQGCIFIPPLKCKNRPRIMNHNFISKLGYKKGSNMEMSEYMEIIPYIKKIKNYEKYFNIRISSCEPDPLSSADLAAFDATCQNFGDDITAQTVNRNLDKLRAINMPNLGTDLRVWMEQSQMDARRICLLNDHISKLLVNAVVPMNDLGIIHNDLKSENLMMNHAEAMLRIVDWGLAGFTRPYQIIPEHYFMNNPVSFNRPFSTMVIQTDINDLYQREIAQLPAKFEPEQLEPFIAEMYAKYRDLSPSSHSYWLHVFESIFKLNSDVLTGLVLNAAIEKYNAQILHHFTSKGKFMLDEYFDKVYRYNTDVWGVMSVYYSIFMLPREHFAVPDPVYAAMLQKYRDLFRKTVFANGHRRMNVRAIVQELQGINGMVFPQYRPRSPYMSQSQYRPRSHKKTVRFHGIARKARHTLHRVPTPHPLKYVREII
jgi:hypothetical protein